MIMGKSFTRLLQAYCRNVSLLEFSSSWWLQRRAKWESWLLVWKRVKNDPMVLNLCLSHILVQEQRSNNTNNVAAASGAVYVYMYMYIYLYFIYIYILFLCTHICIHMYNTHNRIQVVYVYMNIYYYHAGLSKNVGFPGPAIFMRTWWSVMGFGGLLIYLQINPQTRTHLLTNFTSNESWIIKFRQK